MTHSFNNQNLDADYKWSFVQIEKDQICITCNGKILLFTTTDDPGGLYVNESNFKMLYMTIRFNPPETIDIKKEP